MNQILNDFSAEALVAAIRANLFEYYEYLGHSSQAEFHQDPQLKWVFTGIPHSFLNNIFYTQLSPGNTEEAIRTTLASFPARNITKLSWWIEPETQSIDLAESLVRHGLVFEPGSPGMAVDLMKLKEEPLVPGLTIRRVEEPESLEDWVQAAFTGFGLPESFKSICVDLFAGLGFDPPLSYYVGYLDGKPVATSQLFLGAGVAGIYWVSTLPEARHRGIGLAMTQVPLQEARRNGYQIGILHATEQGFNVYRRLGFEEKCRMSHYIWTAK